MLLLAASLAAACGDDGPGGSTSLDPGGVTSTAEPSDPAQQRN